MGAILEARSVISLHEMLKERTASFLGTPEQPAALNPLHYTVLGAVAKIFAASVTYPPQVIKTRLQQRDGELKYKGVADCARKIWQFEGLNGFFRGVIPNAVRVAPNAAITFMVYEALADFLTTNQW